VGVVEGLRKALDATVPPVMLRTYEQLRQQVQSQLGEEAFSALWDQGRTMTQGQVLTIEELAGIVAPGRAESPQFPEH
jgi:hypothetical protein